MKNIDFASLLSLLVIVLAFAIVGGIDYHSALESERDLLQGEVETLRLQLARQHDSAEVCRRVIASYEVSR